MVATISFNPVTTTNASGSFNVESAGYIQGTALDAPNTRNNLAGGVLASTETLPMWGGVAISEAIPGVSGQPSSVLGGIISRATQIGSAGSAGSLTGFSVFDQNYAAISTPQSSVPLLGTGQAVHFYRNGSGARIAVNCAPSLVSLEGGIITQQVSWDFVNQQLVPYYPSEGAVTIASGTWASTNGGTATIVTSSAATLVVGDQFVVTGCVPTAYNGTWTVASISGTTITYLLPAASTPGSITTGGSISAGGGAVACTVLDINVGNSMVVSYNTTTGFATWNRAGTCAIIQI